MTPPVMSREFLDRAQRFQPSSDPDQATAETVALICDQIARSVSDPYVQAAARDALRYRGGPLYKGEPGSAEGIARSVWWWTKARLKFIHHEPMIQALYGERDQLQLLIEPRVLLRTERDTNGRVKAAGDCAVYTPLVCALLKAHGVPFEVVTVACDPSQPTMFTHVYARALVAHGDRLTLDASHGKFPGWEVPRRHVFRKQIWNERGEAIEDAARWNGLHGYTSRGLGATVCNEYLGCYDDQIQFGATAPAPSLSPSPWTGFVQDLAKAWTTIGSRVIAPTTTARIVDPRTGLQQEIVTPGSAPVALSPVLSAGAGQIPGWVWVAGIGFVALMFFRGKR